MSGGSLSWLCTAGNYQDISWTTFGVLSVFDQQETPQCPPRGAVGWIDRWMEEQIDGWPSLIFKTFKYNTHTHPLTVNSWPCAHGSELFFFGFVKVVPVFCTVTASGFTGSSSEYNPAFVTAVRVTCYIVDGKLHHLSLMFVQ